MNPTTVNITTSDLYKKKYDIHILEQNIKNLNKKALLNNQILTADFCVKYILDNDIESGSEDSYIFDKIYILERQPHITEEDFDNCYSLS